ncbi:metallophosphoesterase [Psychroserpens sp.]|uniref:metallophosphoesterase n=1 Tax=Psychroserpens sp. TaxID=2020870 RepID=UPI001B2D3112|nr:metallophosphoesterase [Psychroserpens sp.]MBO6605667.1 metallophosphoesterase family protein [Psychroserpens sp.]MBO6631689.1 metallophosphoesterase family protein [Psychroserpens sp.]MBO6652962.1 metallophosphoesterase family protein [Psychroserpens sp.]MBO6681266.1 metallophosphoesterase family protein [Psychroserpens sp.]MBO6749041.1 metallophosphoesterase family protein [Psychroserpens sp.]
MFSANKRLDRAFKEASKIYFDDSSKYILFSDCHRGDNSFADDFANNRNIYFHALKHYYNEGFIYCELGDGDELWENRSFESLLNAHKNVYLLMKQFHEEGRLHMIWGNHDMVYRNPRYVEKHLSTYFDPKVGEDVELFCDIKYHEALILEHSETRQKLFLMHGHQADWWNYLFWKWSRFLVRILWKPLNVMGIADPTSPAKNYKELIKVERRTKKWISENDNLVTIAGHTHRPRFPEPGDIPFFNDGSCVHPRSITGLEIEQGAISLIKWQIATTDDGILKIVRVLLEGPIPIKDYKTH